MSNHQKSVTLTEAIALGKTAEKKGNLREAELVYSSILKSLPNHSEANFRLGIIASLVGKFELAEDFLEKAIQSDPNNFEYWQQLIHVAQQIHNNAGIGAILNRAINYNFSSEEIEALKALGARQSDNHTSISAKNLAVTKKPKTTEATSIHSQLKKADKLRRNGDFERANELYAAVLKKFPGNQKAKNGLKSINHDNPDAKDPPQTVMNELYRIFNSAKYSELEFKTKALLKQWTNSSALYNILGIANVNLKDFETAVANYMKSLELNPYNHDTMNNLAVCYKQHGKLDLAIEWFEKAIKIKRDFDDALVNLASTQFRIGLVNKAKSNLEAALAANPANAAAHNAMGMLLSTQANFELARLHYEKAISLEPLFIDAHANLLEALELQGKLDELSNKIRKIEKIFSEVPSELRLYNALLFMRQNEISEALKVLDKIDEDALSAPRKLSFYEMKGKALDKASEFEAAFVTFDRLSKLKKESNMYDKKTANSYLYEYQKLYSEIKLLSENYHRKKGTPENKVVFLIGFPRSGTTLLDTILRSHSKVTVIEEEPLIWKAKTDLAQNGQYNYLTSHPSDSKIAIALENYLKSAKVLSSASEDQIIIDKLPLNILELPFINTLFPNAKVILAVRHPLDCILSNWMQNFRLNPAMSNLITLEEIVEFYDLSMSLCEQANYKLGINPYIIRYEDLVDNFHPEVLNLLNYLCLTWEDGVTNYHKTAHERKYIKTPSRSQVIQPLYGTSKYKWKNYEGYLRDYFPKLNKWIEKFNYNALP